MNVNKMSEFFEENSSSHMNIEDNNIDIDNDNFENIKSKYYEIKRILHTLFSFFIMFEDDFYLTLSDIRKFLNFHNIIDLSYIIHSYYILQNNDMLESAHHILQKSMMTDDILDEDLFMYCKAYTLIKINDETHKHNELFDNILYISNYHNHYLSGKLENIINMIQFEESFNILTL